MVEIKYYRFKGVQIVTSFKILNLVSICIPLDLENKILTVKWTELRELEIERFLFCLVVMS